MRTALRACCALLLLAPALPATARPALEIFELRHRPAAELIEVIRPLAGSEASVTGAGYTLFVKADPERLADVRRAVHRLDVPLRNLMITVRQVPRATLRETEAQARGTVTAGGEVTAGVRARQIATTRREDDAYRVRTLEGRPAYVHVGRWLPYRSQEIYAGGRRPTYGSAVDYRLSSSGFLVTPHLRGETVELEIAPRRERPSPAGPGPVESYEVQSVIRGRLGEWIELAGVETAADLEERRTAGRTVGTGREDHVTQVRVDLLP